MFGFIWAIVARTRYFVRRLLPTNLLLDAIHTRRGLRWGIPAMLLAVPYGLAALLCLGMAEGGAPGWLNLLGLLFIWNALKFLVAGPVTVIQLLRVRAREARIRRATAGGLDDGDGNGRLDPAAEPSGRDIAHLTR
jgi:hypothetical protein